MAIVAAQKPVELREVLLKDKPDAMLAASEKGTVPVLVEPQNVVDESLDVMRWAFDDSTNDQWSVASLASSLIEINDGDFKYWLDHYKYFERFPEHPRSFYLEKAQKFLITLEESLQENGSFLLANKPQAVDLAVFPFIRQFAYSDIKQFQALPYLRLQNWLDYWLASDLFKAVMEKYDVWQDGQYGVAFGETK